MLGKNSLKLYCWPWRGLCLIWDNVLLFTSISREFCFLEAMIWKIVDLPCRPFGSCYRGLKISFRTSCNLPVRLTPFTNGLHDVGKRMSRQDRIYASRFTRWRPCRIDWRAGEAPGTKAAVSRRRNVVGGAGVGGEGRASWCLGLHAAFSRARF